MLETYLRKKLGEKEILLMTHTVLGYPSFDECFRVIEVMVEAGVDLVELQLPFTEPIADGPVILRANQRALERRIRVNECLDFAGTVARSFDTPFLFMTYYNIPFKYGIQAFVAAMAERHLWGAIVPDLPPEEGMEYFQFMSQLELAPILIFSPTTPSERMKEIASSARGFIYCVARRGVTGEETRFSEETGRYLERCRLSSKLPLAVGFGVKNKADIDFLRGRGDIAVIGSEVIRVLENEGVNAVGRFIGQLLE